MNNLTCIYHSRDLDGHASAAIVKHKYPHANLIGFDYGQQLPYDKIPAGDPVIMVDVSLPMAEMSTLSTYTNHQLTWIDHHASAIADFKNYQCAEAGAINAVLQNGIAACELTWKHLFPDKYMPVAISLLGKYDTWRNADADEWDSEILPFQFGMRAICNSPQMFPVDLLNPINNEHEMQRVLGIIKQGQTILSYQAQVNAAQCQKAFEATFLGLRAICLNTNVCNSHTFKPVYDDAKHDIMMPFCYDGLTGVWTFSLYTQKPNIDCGQLAKQMGGGGHKMAAGFIVGDLTTVFNKINAYDLG